MQMKNPNTTMEIRVWGGSELIGKSVGEISSLFGVNIIKVSRGEDASNPDPELKIFEADYIRYVGESDSCLRLLNKSVKDDIVDTE